MHPGAAHGNFRDILTAKFKRSPGLTDRICQQVLRVRAAKAGESSDFDRVTVYDLLKRQAEVLREVAGAHKVAEGEPGCVACWRLPFAGADCEAKSQH